MNIVKVYTSPDFAKEVVVASMQGKDIDLKGLLTPLIVNVDGAKIISLFYRNLDIRISEEEFEQRKEFYLKKNPEAQIFVINLSPDFDICQEISKQLKLNSGCITFCVHVNVL